jgi:MscS family membrane protein
MGQITLLEQQIFGNPLQELLICLGILLFGFLLKRFSATLLSRQSFRFFKKFSQNEFSDEFVALLRKPIEQMLTLIILFLAFDRLVFPESWHMAAVEDSGVRNLLLTGWLIAMFITGTRILLRATDFFTLVMAHRKDSTVSAELANFVKELIKVLIVIACVFSALRFIFEVNITALVASLGIGGLAVALAAQDTLANLLGSFIIYLDKPFKVGDQVESGDIKGKVEHVGFRTTRIRTVDKSLLTVPNKKLIDTALNNVTLVESKRISFVLALSYKSNPEQMKAITADIKSALLKNTHVSKDLQVSFSDIANNSLNISVIYFIMSDDNDVIVDVKETINIQIMHIVAKHGCEFAASSQNIFFHK